MRRTITLLILVVLFWVAIMALCIYLLGPDGGAFGFLFIGGVGLLLLRVQKWHFKKALRTIVDVDTRSIRFDGKPGQVPLAIEIGTAKGWIAEPLQLEKPQLASICFVAGEDACTARDLLEALFEARLVTSIKPPSHG